MTDQSLMSRLGARIMPRLSQRVFPAEWIEAGDDHDRLAEIAGKRRALDGPRPDLVLQRSWKRATTDIGGHPLHLLTPTSGSTGRVLFYCHGGAFVVGPSSLEWLFAARFATAIHADLALYEYPRVPEHDSTVIRATTLTAWDAIAARYAPDDMTMAGLSAGGSLAVSTMVQLHRSGRRLPLAAALFSPWLDMTVSHPDAEAMAETDKLLPLSILRRDGRLYAGATGVTDPLVSPRFASKEELSALPPTVVTAGEHEVLVPEAREFVDNLGAAGTAATLHVEPFGQHVGVMARTPEGNEVFGAASAQMKRLVRGT